MEISFGAFRGTRSYGSQQRDLCGFEAAKLKAENNALRTQNQRLQAAVAQRNTMLQRLARRDQPVQARRGAAVSPRVAAAVAARAQQGRGVTAPRAPAVAPRAPSAAPAAQVTVPIRPTAPQMLETDRDFTQPSDDALTRAWYGGHLGGAGYDGLESSGIGLEDALGLDG